MATKTTKPVESSLPVVDFYNKLPKAYKAVVSQQALALMLREGVTNPETEFAISTNFDKRTVGPNTQATLLLQGRDLACQLLIEQRRTNKLLEAVLKEARK